MPQQNQSVMLYNSASNTVGEFVAINDTA